MENELKIAPDARWSAWYNMMGPGHPILHVTGEVDVGTHSMGASLVFDSLEKKSPPTLVLKVVPQTIFIPRDKGDHIVKLHFSQGATPGSYGSVKVVYSGKEIAHIKKIQIAW